MDLILSEFDRIRPCRDRAGNPVLGRQVQGSGSDEKDRSAPEKHTRRLEFNREPSALIGEHRRLTIFRYAGAIIRQERISTADERRLTPIENVPMNFLNVSWDAPSRSPMRLAPNSLKGLRKCLGARVDEGRLKSPSELNGGSVTIGTYVADLLVENAVSVEIKAVKAQDTNHDTQCDQPHHVFVDEFRQSSPGDQAPGQRLLIHRHHGDCPPGS
jgi:hypothetical protein